MAFEILDPTGGAAQETTLAPRTRASIHGARVGVIWNGRSNGDTALREILSELEERFDVEVALFRKKPLIGNVAPTEILDEVAAERVDFALAGVGD